MRRNLHSKQHILSLFVFYFKWQIQQDCDRFPTILPGKLTCRWMFEIPYFTNFGHLKWQFGIFTCKSLHVFTLFFPTISDRSAYILEAPLCFFCCFTRLKISFNFIFIVFNFWINNSSLHKFVFCTSVQPANFEWRLHGIVLPWWFLGYADRLAVSPQHREMCELVFLFQCLFCFPQEPLKLSVPGNNYMFPSGSPNIWGIRRHLACKSLFLSLTLCIAFYFPPRSSSLSVLAASQQYKHSVSFLFLFDFTSGGLIHSFSYILTSPPILLISF